MEEGCRLRGEQEPEDIRVEERDAEVEKVRRRELCAAQERDAKVAAAGSPSAAGRSAPEVAPVVASAAEKEGAGRQEEAACAPEDAGRLDLSCAGESWPSHQTIVKL